MRSLRYAIVLTALIGSAAPALADDAKPRPKADPNRLICEDQPVLGSRLGGKRVCLTRAQWDDKYRQERQMIERSQVNSCQKGAGC